VRVSELVGKTVHLPLNDAAFSTTCPGCDTRQTLAEARFLDQAPLSLYFCWKGCPDPLVGVREKGKDEYALEMYTPSGMQEYVPPEGPSPN
jgi:hypothetical protein